MFGIMAFLTLSTTFTTVLVGGAAAQIQIPSLSSIVPSLQTAMAAPILDCDGVDDDSQGDCEQEIDQNADGFTDCNDDNINNCIAEQIVEVHNDLNSNEEARIDQTINQRLDCDNNIACEQSSENDGFQEVDVETLDNPSTVDFDVAQTMTQTLAQGGQSNFNADNLGFQSFEIDALGTSRVDADGDGSDNIRMILNQLTDECDGSPTSNCINDMSQSYDIRTESNGFVDISTTQGIEATQTNIDCDNGVTCSNDAFQDIVIEANDDTTGSAFVDFETGSSFSDLVQRNECENNNGGVAFTCFNGYDLGDLMVQIDAEDNSEVDVDNFGQDETQINTCTNAGSGGCSNYVEPNFDISSAGTSTVEVSGGQDSIQDNDCSDGADCENNVEDFNYDVISSGSANVDVDGTQTADQENDCDDEASCFNDATFDARFTASGTSSIDSDFTQLVDQDNACTNGANCDNIATVQYFVTASDGAIITTDSDQSIFQTNTCSTGQNCVNTGTLTNNVFASGTARLNADSTQTLTQTCTTSSGSNCMNTNTVTTSGTATNTAILNYVTSQNIQNPNDGSGTASITISRSSGTSNVGPISQTSNGNIVG